MVRIESMGERAGETISDLSHPCVHPRCYTGDHHTTHKLIGESSGVLDQPHTNASPSHYLPLLCVSAPPSSSFGRCLSSSVRCWAVGSGVHRGRHSAGRSGILSLPTGSRCNSTPRCTSRTSFASVSFATSGTRTTSCRWMVAHEWCLMLLLHLMTLTCCQRPLTLSSAISMTRKERERDSEGETTAMMVDGQRSDVLCRRWLLSVVRGVVRRL